MIINRLDSICHAILKGKWPSSSEQYDSLGSLAANSCLANSLAQHHQHRASYLPTTAQSSVTGQPRVQQANQGLGFPIPPPLTRLPKVRTFLQRDEFFLCCTCQCIVCLHFITLSYHGSYQWCPVCMLLIFATYRTPLNEVKGQCNILGMFWGNLFKFVIES